MLSRAKREQASPCLFPHFGFWRFLLRTDHLWSKDIPMLPWRARHFRAMVAVLAALAWFAGTQHCLLGLMKDPRDASAPTCHCPEHSRTSGGRDNGSMLACCQGLLSSGLELAQAKVTFNPILFGLQPITFDQLVRLEALRRASFGPQHETGPPGESCFLTIVLKRSLQENAPPLFA
jgi:hypothetical protein